MKTKYLKINDKTYNATFYDSLGQERYRSLANDIITNDDGILLIYDITSKKSFDSIPNWIDDIINVKDENVSVVLCGNKSDLKDNRQVSKEEEN